jgi:hypothetical protein
VAKTSRTEGGEKKPSQKQLVQSALDDLGRSAMPQALHEHIKTKFGVELPPNIISNYKSQIKRENGGSGRGRRTELKIEDFETVRGLVQRLGADQVQRLVEVVG